MQKVEIQKRKLTYFERNAWLKILIIVFVINIPPLFIAGYFLNYNDGFYKIYSITSFIVRTLSVFAVIYAGVLNYMTNTLSAQIFRALFVASLAGAIIYALFF